MTRSPRLMLFSFLCAAVLMVPNPCTAQSYTLTEIPISPTAINNHGQIGGQAPPTSDPSGVDPFILSNGSLKDLGNFGGSCNVNGCRAYALNSLGDAVGLTADGTGGYKPFLFSNGTLARLTPDNANPLGINTAGTIVGYLENSSGGEEGSDAFVIKNGVLTDLGGGEAQGINTAGQIAGTTTTGGQFEAAVWQPDGTLTLLGFLPGETYSRAFAINDAGQVTGNALTGNAVTNVPPYAEHAFLFSNGQMTDIDTLNSESSWAFAINNNGVVVGQFRPAYHAFVYMGGSMMDLNTLILAGSDLTLYQANGINDSGEIVGYAQSNSDGSVHGFLLTPVPPQITSISPATGVAGTVVTINGKNFTKKPAACKVTINGKVAKSTKWTSTQLQVQVPEGATTGHVVVTAFFQKSNGKTFTVIK